MGDPTPTPLPLAIRVYPVAAGLEELRSRGLSRWRRPTSMFVFDTETRVDETQRLTFGSYRFFDSGICLEEGLFFADDLSPSEIGVLKHYAVTHLSAADRRKGVPKLLLLTRREFLEKLFIAAYKARALVVGFNLPFDFSRLAFKVGEARDRFAGGFSLALWDYTDRDGRRQENKHRPRVAIKHIDSKRALKGFTSARDPDLDDLLIDGATGGSQEKQPFRGNFLDLRTLAFVLTDRGHTLESACTAFGIERGKIPVREHGRVSSDYIDYNRNDVQKTCELANKLLEEYDRFDVDLQPTKAYSPASLGKAHLRRMGIRPVLERQPNFSRRHLGYAQSAFFGGRTSAHIRKVPLPVVYTDFRSMYPTVNSLMNLWQFVVAEKIEVRKHCADEIERFLRSITLESLFNPSTWSSLTAFVKIEPDGDVLPTRAKYSSESNDWQVAINYLYAGDEPNHHLWFALPDIVASVILTSKLPKVVDAFRIVPIGQVAGLKPVRLRGTVTIDPRTADFFRTIIEERQRYSATGALSKEEGSRLDKALKVLANATSYGIFAEMIRQELDRNVSVKCFGVDPRDFECRVRTPEIPGEYCFPPLASLITAGARLMLALLERSVTDQGGTYAMEDTDSMAIVATRDGGPVPCPGGQHKTRNGKPAVSALSWRQVAGIIRRFERLNPYDREAVPDSILKLEADNFTPGTRNQRQLWCLAISAKRYSLFLRNSRGEPELLRRGVNNHEDRWSEHGLGHLLNPSDPNSEDRSWVAHAWLRLIRKSLGFPVRKLRFESRVAVSRTSISSPPVLRPLQALNNDKPYDDQIKPFNFIVTCHVRKLGHPVGVDPERFHLLAQFESDATRWCELQWIDQYSGKTFVITTDGAHGGRHTARVKSYADVLREYEFHAEAKCADFSGTECKRQTVGVLKRRHVTIESVRYIGKESNKLEDVAEQTIDDPRSVYTEYPDPQRDEWTRRVLPLLKAMPLPDLQRQSGLARSTLQAVRAGRRPHRRNKQKLTEIANQQHG